MKTSTPPRQGRPTLSLSCPLLGNYEAEGNHGKKCKKSDHLKMYTSSPLLLTPTQLQSQRTYRKLHLLQGCRQAVDERPSLSRPPGASATDILTYPWHHLDAVTGTNRLDGKADLLQRLAVEHEAAVKDERGAGAVVVDYFESAFRSSVASSKASTRT